ncbi:response regulator [Sandaracinobacter neustonicus]|uniref:histidine kinase n=1 Tax=Sandaracinobacter neustonicus TaxID=1715348 RepID=A0A501XFT1_9SPHN|nr:PAS-domain containing protein [Sandaracinobacter neustonicus]TPE59432.1 response regulator [Sandaracinobacter neustonicus]
MLPALFVILYGAGLFWLAARTERRGIPHRLQPWVFPLSLAVYCTSWTFFGGVGSAASVGLPYLSIYLGPALLFLLAPGFLSRLAARTAEGRASSISDFLGQRYGRSRSLAALVAALALLAATPYIALQLRSVSMSFEAVSGLGRSPELSFLIAALLATFSISFGARRVEVTGRNPGIVAAVAAESLVKLIAFVALGLFAAWLLWRSPQISSVAGATALASRMSGSFGPDFLIQTLLGALAILCLPRQFYLGFVEAPDAAALRRARWPFVAYLALISLMVLPLAAAGLALLPPGTRPDLFVLALPLSEGARGLALLAFLGGFSAATGMVIAETLALSTMAANDLLAPLLIRARLREGTDLGRLMLRARRVIIVAILLAAWAYAEAIDDAASLAAIGLIAFAGVAQFAPALIGAVSFRFENKQAARAGLIAGLALWAYTLFLPSFGGPGLVGVLDGASAGLLNPQRLFGLDLGSALVHGTLWSLGANCVALFAFARFGRARSGPGNRDSSFGHVTTLGELTALAGRFAGDREAEIALAPFGGPDSSISGPAARRAEQMIADVIGAPSARLIVTSTMAGSGLGVGEVVKLLDRSGQSLQFSRQMLEATLQAIDPGVSVVDRRLRLVAWNQRYLDLFDYPAGLVEVGRPVADLIRYNALSGEWGPGEADAHVERRLYHLARGLPHSFERLRPTGRWIKTVGAAMPGGGYVMSFTDITAEKAQQEELEARVAERTADLAAANSALAEAKAAAETATREKTRFLAAASHDLLQPLHAARLFLSALERQTPDPARPLLDSVSQSIASADGLLRALLDVSKLDAGGIKPRPAPFSARELVEELGLEFEALAAEKGLRLLARSVDAMVETDRELLRSILLNFLSNAVRYTASGSIAFTARRRGGIIRFAVADSGPGIAADAQARIFREFERLDGGAPGVGLGLAIVERTARLLNTPVHLRSAPGRGSVFAVDIPVSATAPAERRAAPPPARAAAVGLRVLCVDDDPAVLEALGAALSAHGHEPLLAATALEAMALARSHRPAAAILDYQLGDGPDGLTLARQLRRRDPAMPIAMVTASAATGLDWRLRRLSIRLFAKPADPARLFAFLAESGRAAAE